MLLLKESDYVNILLDMVKECVNMTKMKIYVDDKKVLKTLKKLGKPVRAAYSAWKNILSNEGMEGLRKIKGFHFEKLKGNRKGQHSCRLNRGYRVIFIKTDISVIIEVLEVNKHEY
jgi:plasmid maintenance system killer protein